MQKNKLSLLHHFTQFYTVANTHKSTGCFHHYTTFLYQRFIVQIHLYSKTAIGKAIPGGSRRLKLAGFKTTGT